MKSLRVIMPFNVLCDFFLFTACTYIVERYYWDYISLTNFRLDGDFVFLIVSVVHNLKISAQRNVLVISDLKAIFTYNLYVYL